MKEALIVFSIISLVAACIVFDQYTAEERKAILAKMGVKMPVDANNQGQPARNPYQQSTPLENDAQPDRHPSSNVDAVYYCMKDGKKIISDSPCENHSADEEQRRYYVRTDVQPGIASAQQLEREKAVLKRMEDDRKIREVAAEKRVQARAQSNEAEQKKERICNSLYAEKDSIKAIQRQLNSDYWNQRHREVDDEIYYRKCGFR